MNILNVLPSEVTTWNSSTLNMNFSPGWVPLPLSLLSPVPVDDPQTQAPMENVKAVHGHFIIKNDGSLWSVGQDLSTLGREPQPPTDLYNGPGSCGTIGMIPGRVEIPGNDINGILPGREIEEVVDQDFSYSLARCKDGSLWFWGRMFDWSAGPGDGISFSLRLGGEDESPEWKPRRLLDVEAASPFPVCKISAGWNHIILLRTDGSLSDVGLIPYLDDARMSEMYTWPNTFVPLDECYSATPVTVTNAPPGIIQICADSGFGAVLTEAGEVWVWGHWGGRVGEVILPTPQKISTLSNIKKIAIGDQYIIALDKRGRLFGVGYNRDNVFNCSSDEYFNYFDGAVLHTNAVRIAGIENVTDVFSEGIAGYWDSGQVYAIGAEIQGKPVGLLATPMNQAVQLSWSNYPAASSYIVYRSLNEDAGYVAIGNSTLHSYLPKPTVAEWQNLLLSGVCGGQWSGNFPIMGCGCHTLSLANCGSEPDSQLGVSRCQAAVDTTNQYHVQPIG
jgi:hypothetical protein